MTVPFVHVAVLVCPCAAPRPLDGRAPEACVSAEGEDVSAHARVEEGDLEVALDDCGSLTDELVHPGLGDGPLARHVDVEAVGIARRLPVDAHGEADRSAGGRAQGQG